MYHLLKRFTKDSFNYPLSYSISLSGCSMLHLFSDGIPAIWSPVQSVGFTSSGFLPRSCPAT